jgi:hypothetical protein
MLLLHRSERAADRPPVGLDRWHSGGYHPPVRLVQLPVRAQVLQPQALQQMGVGQVLGQFAPPALLSGAIGGGVGPRARGRVGRTGQQPVSLDLDYPARPVSLPFFFVW